LELVVSIVGAGVVGFAGKQLAPREQLVTEAAGIEVHSPLLIAKGSSEIESDVLKEDTGRSLALGHPIPALVASDLIVFRAVHDRHKNPVFRVHLITYREAEPV
jgi:hypothetical protein